MTIVTLGEIVEIKGGGTPDTSVGAYWGGNIPWATVKDFKSTEIDNTIDRVTDLGVANSATNIIPAGSILVPTRMAVGKAAINTVEMAINQDLKALRPKDGVDTRYLLHALLAKAPDLERQATGATVKGITLDVLRSLEIPLPRLAEQRRIATILDQGNELRRKRQRAMDLLIKLGHATFYEMFGDPDINPKAWRVVSVDAVTDCIVPGRDKPKSFSGDIPWITTAEIKHLGATGAEHSKAGLSAAEIKQVRARIVPQNSVIMTCVGDLGKITIADCQMVINQQLHSFQCDDEINPIYLMFMLSYRKPWMIKRATQTTLPYMNKSICNAIPIMFPPIDDQTHFSRRISALIAINKSMTSNASEANSLFQVLQRRAFKGEL